MQALRRLAPGLFPRSQESLRGARTAAAASHNDQCRLPVLAREGWAIMEHDIFLIYILVLIVLFTLAYLFLRLRREAKAIAARRQARINAGPARRR